VSSLWIEFVTALVQINLLLTKFESFAIPKSNGFHP